MLQHLAQFLSLFLVTFVYKSDVYLRLWLIFERFQQLSLTAMFHQAGKMKSCSKNGLEHVLCKFVLKAHTGRNRIYGKWETPALTSDMKTTVTGIFVVLVNVSVMFLGRSSAVETRNVCELFEKDIFNFFWTHEPEICIQGRTRHPGKAYNSSLFLVTYLLFSMVQSVQKNVKLNLYGRINQIIW